MADRQADEQPTRAEQRPLVTLAEAGRLTGRHPEALRAMVRRGRLRMTRGNDGRMLIELPDEATGLGAGQQPAEAGRLAGQVDELDELVADLRDELGVLKVELARAEADRDAARTVAEARVEAKDALISELRELLADARRPWWRKLVGR